MLYARISQDKAGESLGVERQMKDLRALAEREGWQVIAELTDNDVSAYSGARRPGYEQVLDLVRAGQVDVVAAWHVSRLWRRTRERVDALELLADARVDVAVCSGPSFDLSTAYGRSLATMIGELDTMESAVKSERVRAAVAQRVEKRRPVAGMGYGYGRDEDRNVVIIEEQAAILREIAHRLLDGETAAAICRDLEDRQVPPPGARHRRSRTSPENPTLTRWRPMDLKRAILRPTLAGLLVHKGQVVGKGDWPAILDQATQERLRTVLETRNWRQASNPTGDNARRWLLSWTAVCTCGVCGSRMVAKTRRQRYGQPYDSYACPGGHSTRRMSILDPIAEAAALERLAQPDLASVLAVEAGSQTGPLIELERLQAQLDDAVVEFEAGRLSAALLGTVEARLTPRIETLRAEVSTGAAAAQAAATTLAPFRRARDPRAVWDALDVPGRLAVLEVLGVRIRVMPTDHRGPWKPGDDPAVEIDYEAQS